MRTLLSKRVVVGMAIGLIGVSAFGSRSVSIASSTQTTATLAFGAADGKAYQLYVGYGAKDAEGDTSQWTTFEKVADVAADETGTVYTLPSGWGTTVKAVRFFLVEVVGRTITSEWWRFTFTKDVYDGQRKFTLGDIKLWQDIEMTTDNAQGTTPGSGAASSLAQGKAITTLNLATASPDSSKYGIRDLSYCFDNSRYNAIYATLSADLKNANQSITLRLAAGKNAVVAYSMSPSYGAWYWNPHSWYVEVSDDGTTWMKVDARSEQMSGSGYKASSYVPALPVVSSQSETLKAMDILTIAAGSPLTISDSVTYDEVVLYDKLTLASGGNLKAAKVSIMGEQGGLIAAGGSLDTSTLVVLSADCTAASGCVDFLRLSAGSSFTLMQAKNENASVAARVVFDGGSLRVTSFDAKPFTSANGGKWILEATDGNDIVFGDLGLQRFYWLDGDGTVETRGNGNLVIYDNNYNAPNDFRGMVYMNASTTAANWTHAGDFVLSNDVTLVCQADNCLPFGANTGKIGLTWPNRGIHRPVLDLNGKTVSVNGLEAGAAGGVGVTNSASTFATLVLGEGNMSGEISNVVFAQWNINIKKVGTGEAVIAHDEHSSAISSYTKHITVEGGKLSVCGAKGDLLWAANVTVAEGAELVVDGQTLRVDSLSGAGTVTTLNGGTIVYNVGSYQASDTQVLYDDISTSIGELSKIGTSRTIVQQANVFGGDITVGGGTLVFSGRQCTNEWYRWVLKGNHYNDSRQIALGELWLYPDATKGEMLGTDMTPGSSAASLAKGQVVASFATTTTKSIGASCNLWDIRNVFDGDIYNAVNSASSYLLSANNQTVTFRMAEGKNRVGCYLPANSYCNWYCHPSAWDFQTSGDGVTWTTLDSRSGVYRTSGGELNDGVPYALKGFLADNAKGFAETAKVRVANGATLDIAGVAGGQSITHLSVSAQTGAGTIVGGTFADSGTLELTGVVDWRDHAETPIPLTLVNVSGVKNLEHWQLVINGVQSSRTVSYRDGGLVINKIGLYLILY